MVTENVETWIGICSLQRHKPMEYETDIFLLLCWFYDMFTIGNGMGNCKLVLFQFHMSKTH